MTIKSTGAPKSRRNKNKSSSLTRSETVHLKNYINNRLTIINLTSSVLALAFLAVNTFILFSAAQKNTNNVYFQVDKENRIVEIVPVDQPNQSIPSVASWLKGALEETFFMNFYDYKERLSSNTSLYFTQDGASQLIEALDNSKNLDLMVENEMWISLTVDNPVFIKRGVINGVYTWHFQVRGQLSQYNVASRAPSEDIVFDLYVKRVSELETERGLGISRLVMDRI